MKYIKTFENFVSDNLNENKSNGKDTNFDLKTFKDFFNSRYSYISHDIKDNDIQKYIDDNKEDRKHAKRTLASVADLFQDYLVSQGLADVQESENYIKTLEQFSNIESNEIVEGIKNIVFKGKKVNDLYRIVKDEDDITIKTNDGKEYTIDDTDELRNDLQATTVTVTDDDDEDYILNISDIKIVQIDESIKSYLTFANFVNERSMLETSITDVVGLRQTRVVIEGPNLKKHADAIIKMIKKNSPDNNVQYYDKTDKIVGNVIKVKIESIERDLKSFENGKIKLEEKAAKR